MLRGSIIQCSRLDRSIMDRDWSPPSWVEWTFTGFRHVFYNLHYVEGTGRCAVARVPQLELYHRQTESAFVTLPATRTGWIELSSELWLLNVMHPVVLTNIYLFLTTLYSDILWPSLYCGITLCNFLIVIILRWYIMYCSWGCKICEWVMSR